MSRVGKNRDPEEAEWQRVLQNPDNMIVSDSLRDDVASILANRSEDTNFYVEFLIADRLLTLELIKLDRAKDKTTISGMCDRIAVKPFLALGTEHWAKAQILCGSDQLFEISLADMQLDVSHEFSSTAGVCFITLTCTQPAVKSTKRVL